MAALQSLAHLISSNSYFYQNSSFTIGSSGASSYHYYLDPSVAPKLGKLHSVNLAAALATARKIDVSADPRRVALLLSKLEEVAEPRGLDAYVRAMKSS